MIKWPLQTLMMEEVEEEVYSSSLKTSKLDQGVVGKLMNQTLEMMVTDKHNYSHTLMHNYAYLQIHAWLATLYGAASQTVYFF